ncbi:glycoside hydrolase family 71/99-like protein [Pseudopedobacter beijingensis]|uniref:Glycoside hydrolase family 71/99-like protein n=1 Tax=Pseudopedobacter beijingensis TaxID=1207056 RepID=A0ABW4IG32_9SPHI
MKLKGIVILLCALFSSCKKSGGDSNPPDKSKEITVYEPQRVNKTVDKKVYVHLMPWFEDKTTNDQAGKWGQHWTMANKNPDITDGNGIRQIAAHYYPLTGPYASGDPDIIEYQLLLMKLSGIDGVVIDWPGITKLYDYPLLVRNTEKFIELIGKVGLNFAIVYEDQNINIAFDNKVITNKIGAAQGDMTYMETKYFKNSNYIKIDGKPLLLVFGPQTFQSESEWTQVFAPLNTKPAFFTLWNESNEAGKNASGEFAWVYKNHLDDLNGFYSKTYSGIKISSAYPGFHAFYQEGGWGTNPFKIDVSLQTFSQTLDLALQSNAPYMQLVTWNDYGEGTMIEPTQQFQYGFLTILQNKLGVQNIKEEDLKAVSLLYELRKKYKANTEKKKNLDQAFYYFVSLKLSEARSLLETTK